MNLRKQRERRAPRRFEDELDQIYAPETPEPRVIRPASRPARPLFPVASKPFNPGLRPAAFPSFPLDDRLGNDCHGDDDGVTEDSGAIDSTVRGSEGTTPGGQTLEGSLIVRLRLDADAGGSQPVTLRELVEREDSREAAPWSAEQELPSIVDTDGDRLFRRYGVSYNTSLEEQRDTCSTLPTSKEETRVTGNPGKDSSKVKFSGLHLIMRCTIMANMYIGALEERFYDPFFPIQRLLDISAESIIQALDVIEDAYLDGEYPTCLSSPTMLESLLQTRQFLIQQNWPRHFLKPVDLAKCITDPGAEVKHPHAPKAVHNMPAADLVFFGRQEEVHPRELSEAFLDTWNDIVPRRTDGSDLPDIQRSTPGGAEETYLLGLQEYSQRSRLKLGRSCFREGAAQQELQRLRFGGRQGHSPVREEPAAYSPWIHQQRLNPQLVRSPPLTQSKVFSVSTTALRQGSPTPTLLNAPSYSTTLVPLRQMLPLTAPSSPSPSPSPPGLPSTIYGPSSSIECSEVDVLMMLGAAASAAIPQTVSYSSSPPREREGEEANTPAIESTPNDDGDESSIISTHLTRSSQLQLSMTHTPPSTPMTMDTEPSSPSLQRQQRQQQLLRPRPELAASSPSAMLLLFERNYHRHIQEQQAAQAMAQVRSLRGVLTTRGKDQEQGQEQQQAGRRSDASMAMADNRQHVHTPSPGTAASQPNSPGLYFSSAASRTGSAASRPSSSTASSSLSTETTAVITPPSSIPVAPMLSTITTTANATATVAASNNGLGTAGAAGPATAGAARSQKPAFPNSARKRNAIGTTTTNATANNSNNRRASAATTAVHGQLALPGVSGERGTSSNNNSNGVGGRHHYRGGGIIRSQLTMSHNSDGMRRNGGGAMPMASPQPQLPLPSPQLSLLSTPSLLGNVHLAAATATATATARLVAGNCGDVVGMSAEKTAAALRGGEEGEGEQGEEEEEEEEAQKEKEEEGKTRPKESGGKTEGKDPYGMFMKGVVEYAGSD